MKLLSRKTYILISLAILLAAGLAVAVFWHSSRKTDSQKVQNENPQTLSSGQADQTYQTYQTYPADQISAIDKSAREDLGGDYKVEGASFVAEPKEANGVKVQVGDKSAKEVSPELTLSRWDEAQMKIKPKLDGMAAKDKRVSFENDKIKFDTPKIGYNLENLPVSEERPEGGFEYDIVLKEKPATNVVSLGIETENLDFFYQPALTPEEIAHGAQRPENVVGSYAVYHKTMAGDYTALGGKNYKAGKAFHIFRPKIEDATGKWVWGDLNIDEKAALLTVTIPQDFLDKAIYPVRHAAGLEFGYTSQGASNLTMVGVHHFLGKANSTPASDGTLQSISAYINGQTADAEFDPALYSDVAGTATALLSAVNSGGTKPGTGGVAICTTTMPSYGVTTGTQYWFGYKSNFVYADGLILYYDSGGVGMPYWAQAHDWPDPWINSGTDPAWKPSIWGTYTPAATGVPIYIKNNVNFKQNVNLK